MAGGEPSEFLFRPITEEEEDIPPMARAAAEEIPRGIRSITRPSQPTGLARLLELEERRRGRAREELSPEEISRINKEEREYQRRRTRVVSGEKLPSEEELRRRAEEVGIPYKSLPARIEDAVRKLDEKENFNRAMRRAGEVGRKRRRGEEAEEAEDKEETETEKDFFTIWDNEKGEAYEINIKTWANNILTSETFQFSYNNILFIELRNDAEIPRLKERLPENERVIFFRQLNFNETRTLTGILITPYYFQSKASKDMFLRAINKPEGSFTSFFIPNFSLRTLPQVPTSPIVEDTIKKFIGGLQDSATSEDDNITMISLCRFFISTGVPYNRGRRNNALNFRLDGENLISLTASFTYTYFKRKSYDELIVPNNYVSPSQKNLRLNFVCGVGGMKVLINNLIGVIRSGGSRSSEIKGDTSGIWVNSVRTYSSWMAYTAFGFVKPVENKPTDSIELLKFFKSVLLIPRKLDNLKTRINNLRIPSDISTDRTIYESIKRIINMLFSVSNRAETDKIFDKFTVEDITDIGKIGVIPISEEFQRKPSYSFNFFIRFKEVFYDNIKAVLDELPEDRSVVANKEKIQELLAKFNEKFSLIEEQLRAGRGRV